VAVGCPGELHEYLEFAMEGRRRLKEQFKKLAGHDYAKTAFSYGYVEPTDAAWWLLERGFEPWLEALARRARLGLEKAPRQLRLGIVEGHPAVGDHISGDERLQSWGPRLRRRGRRQPPPGLTDVGI